MDTLLIEANPKELLLHTRKNYILPEQPCDLNLSIAASQGQAGGQGSWSYVYVIKINK